MSDDDNKVGEFLDSPKKGLQTAADYEDKARGDSYGITKELKLCIQKNIKYVVMLLMILLSFFGITLLFLLIRYVCMINDNENAIGEVISKTLSYIGGIVSAVAIKSFKKKA